MSLNIDLKFTLNGKPTRATVPVGMNALTMIRETLGLTGSKLGCGEGECGACTILVDGRSVNSCLMFAVDCDGRELTTIEGLADETGPHPLQKAFVEHWATQCGFCTPGLIVQAKHVLQRNPKADRQAIARGIEGNLCRCTGYKKIIDAIASVGDSAGGPAD